MNITDAIASRRRAAHTVLVLVGIALAGCGSSASSSSTKTTPSTPAATTTSTTSAALTHEQFIAQLDDICKRGNQAVDRLNAELDKVADTDYAKIASLHEQGVKLTVPYRAEVAKLKPPPEDQATFARYQAANKRIDGISERLVVALRAKDNAELNRLSDLAAAEQKKRTEAALDLGSKNCGA